jgi:hypothetical protein
MRLCQRRCCQCDRNRRCFDRPAGSSKTSPRRKVGDGRMSNPLPRLIERFFGQRLACQRNVSPNTIASYRDTFKLFLKFEHRRTGKFPSDLRLEDFDAELVGAFLDDLDSERHASPGTYNLRLTAIRCFFRFRAFEEPAYSGQIQRVLRSLGRSDRKGRYNSSPASKSKRSSRLLIEERGSAVGTMF